MPIVGLDQPLDARPCQLVGREEAYKHFALSTHPTTSQLHIKPVHWYIACRLVIEGGFHPDDIFPHPPLDVIQKGGSYLLVYNPDKADCSEDTIIGGLKTKDVDVVVGKHRIGPVLAISCKGWTTAQRNLTNRIEEAVGECTNLHISYPSLVLGYMFLMRANRSDGSLAAQYEANNDIKIPSPYAKNDIVVDLDAIGGNRVVETALRFHHALCELSGRQGLREEGSRYEACSLTLLESSGAHAGRTYDSFPSQESVINERSFFSQLYKRYDERYVLLAPSLKRITGRVFWSEQSPLFQSGLLGLGSAFDYPARLLDV